MAIHDPSNRSRKSLKLAFSFALAIWVGVVGLLPPELAGNANANGRLPVCSQFSDGAQETQLSRYVSSRSSARRVELREEDEESPSADESSVAIVNQPCLRKLYREALSFCIVTPDHLIELPGTPPPVAIC